MTVNKCSCWIQIYLELNGIPLLKRHFIPKFQTKTSYNKLNYIACSYLAQLFIFSVAILAILVVPPFNI